MPPHRVMILLTSTLLLLPGAASAAPSECLKLISADVEKHETTRRNLGEEKRRELKTLRTAARILSSNGREDACEALGEAIAGTLANHREKMVEQGVALEIERELRLQELAEARPLLEFQPALRASDIIGSDLRNTKDQELGEIEDVIVEGSDQRLSHLLVSTGGFLGIGSDLVAVPVAPVRATEKLNTLVLPVSPDDLARAPAASEDTLSGPERASWQEKNEVFFQGLLNKQQ